MAFWRTYRHCFLLVAIVAVAAGARLYQLGQTSLWYDEVVTMRLARTDSPTAMLKLLADIDATRAPLHPILLQGWLAIFGTSDVAGRAFSCLCGIVTVAAVFWVGLHAFDRVTALWASWLCALSPLLIYYSRETRMYALLVLVTCLAWGCLFAHARHAARWRLGLYGLCLIALGYTHPLGLLMASTIGLAAILFHRALGISRRGVDFHAHRRHSCLASMARAVLRPRAGVGNGRALAAISVRNADRFHRRKLCGARPYFVVDRIWIAGRSATREWPRPGRLHADRNVRLALLMAGDSTARALRLLAGWSSDLWTCTLHALRGAGVFDLGGTRAGKAAVFLGFALAAGAVRSRVRCSGTRSTALI